jgi:hypothetical protein
MYIVYYWTLVWTQMYEGVSKNFRTESLTKPTTINTYWEATQSVMAAELTRLTHKIAIQLQPSGRELYHLPFSLQAASPETFGYTLVLISFGRMCSFIMRAWNTACSWIHCYASSLVKCSNSLLTSCRISTTCINLKLHFRTQLTNTVVGGPEGSAPLVTKGAIWTRSFVSDPQRLVP